MSKKALAELIDLIGNTAVLGHSQGGPFCWLAADLKPDKVKSCIAVEPNGPPFFNVSYGGVQHSHLNKQTFKKNEFDKDWYQTSSEPDRPNGITYSPLTYDPPLKSGEKLEPELDKNYTSENLVQCFLQKEPARKLVNLSKVNILILTAESSYHAPYDHGTSNFLKQAGVDHDFIRLEDHGIKGNGHMMMHEKNSREVSNFINNWIEKNYV
jgi:pimeloyl-ACP methyl ester carboxylesterase